MSHRGCSAFDLGVEEVDVQRQGCLLIFRCGCRYVHAQRYGETAVYCADHRVVRRRDDRPHALVA